MTVIKDVTELRKLQEQEFQMSLARAVQQQFYSMPPPQIEGFDFAGAAFPADATGGDYFDFLRCPAIASASSSATFAGTVSAPLC